MTKRERRTFTEEFKNTWCKLYVKDKPRKDIIREYDLTRELHDYVHWFNHLRIHGTLNYLTPVEYKLAHLKKLSSWVLAIQKIPKVLILKYLHLVVFFIFLDNGSTPSNQSLSFFISHR